MLRCDGDGLIVVGFARWLVWVLVHDLGGFGCLWCGLGGRFCWFPVLVGFVWRVWVGCC